MGLNKIFSEKRTLSFFLILVSSLILAGHIVFRIASLIGKPTSDLPSNFFIFSDFTLVIMIVLILAVLTVALIPLYIVLIKSNNPIKANESERRFRSISDNLGIGVSIVDPKFRLIFANKQMLKWFPNTQVSKRPLCYSCYNPSTKKPCDGCPVKETLKDGQPHTTHLTKEIKGKQYTYKLSSSPIKNEKGKIVAVLEMVEDMTEYHVMIQELSSHEEKYKHLFEKSQNINILISLDGTIIDLNEKAEQALGMSKDEIIGKNILEFVVREHKEKIAQAISGNENDAMPELELDIITKNDVRTFSFAEGYLTLFKKGQEKSILISATDITEHKRIETELNRKVQELERNRSAILNMMEDLEDSVTRQKHLEKIKTEFLSVTSHEIRTPITPMKAQIQMILGEYFGEVSEEQKKSLDLVLRNINRLDTLIGDILDISKLESGNMKFRLGRANINELLTNSVETMRLKSKDKNITINLDAVEVPNLVVDTNRIIQVVVNLINNAIKFSDEGGKIDVIMNKDSEGIIIEVKDYGIGIPKEDQNRIFNPFEQVDSSASRNYEGTGLGLSICRGIVENHGGSIWVESEPGKGSTFVFTLPYDTNLSQGSTEVELFNYDKSQVLNNFKKQIETEGYVINPERIEELLEEHVLTQQGKLRYNLSLDTLVSQGYISKKEY